ncbi:hypothetical protein CC80DRAFT_573472 [Byssothecium circinans]|uniref:Uncharacterized protein n=1 Tax=Byssothecium circinans TaxID=147558 RepID=A0A6A5THL0_9PLEO|nr:hypothetical protein CC80DRAFT_573472 [Byssothecium circinans]
MSNYVSPYFPFNHDQDVPKRDISFSSFFTISHLQGQGWFWLEGPYTKSPWGYRGKHGGNAHNDFPSTHCTHVGSATRGKKSYPWIDELSAPPRYPARSHQIKVPVFGLAALTMHATSRARASAYAPHDRNVAPALQTFGGATPTTRLRRITTTMSSAAANGTACASSMSAIESLASSSVSPFLCLPRELRDQHLLQIYNYTFALPDSRSDRALRIERRHLRHLQPSAASILLFLHHEYLVLSRQICREALEVLFKHHTLFLSCGPYVLKNILSRIEETRVEDGGYGKEWLGWIKKMEFDWVTFPNLRIYPPERSDGRDEWWWERDGQEIDVDYIRGAQYSSHYDEHDYEGGCGYYDDNFYGAEDAALYPVWDPASQSSPSSDANEDPFGLSSHYPFTDPSSTHSQDLEYDPDEHLSSANDPDSKLSLLISMEVTPLFTYLRTPTFSSLSSLTLPMYFISKPSFHHRNSAARPDATLPLKLRYWVQVCVHALLMLYNSSPSDPSAPSSSSSSTNALPSLREVKIKYMPWDIWASMDPMDNLHRMVDRGIWFTSDDAEPDVNGNDVRAGEGEAFRAVWNVLREKHGLCEGDDRMGLRAKLRFVKWEGDLDKWRVGDELEVVFTR